MTRVRPVDRAWILSSTRWASLSMNVAPVIGLSKGSPVRPSGDSLHRRASRPSSGSQTSIPSPVENGGDICACQACLQPGGSRDLAQVVGRGPKGLGRSHGVPARKGISSWADLGDDTLVAWRPAILSPSEIFSSGPRRPGPDGSPRQRLIAGIRSKISHRRRCPTRHGGLSGKYP